MAKNQDPNTQFRINRANKIKEIYADEVSTDRRFNRTISTSGNKLNTAAQVRDALNKALQDSSKVVQMSRELYAKNPIYMQIIDYLYIQRVKQKLVKLLKKMTSKLFII